jgi:hypothetical protein
MSESNSTLQKFLSAVKPSQVVWALQDKVSEDWVVLDSPNFEDTDAMPLWSSEALANQHCVEEWSDYIACEITVADWLEFWLEDLKEDNVVIGINWPETGDCVELELNEFTQAIASIETL